jgi:hypothetical protein
MDLDDFLDEPRGSVRFAVFISEKPNRTATFNKCSFWYCNQFNFGGNSF